MDWIIFVLIAILDYLIYKGLSENKTKSQVETVPRRTTGRGANYSQDREKDSLIQSAKRQERLNNHSEASRLYLRAGQVFSAAKMKAMQGTDFISEAIELIRVNSPERSELIVRNLANEFFYRMERPATAAALLRGLGLHDEAEAVEVAAGIQRSETITEQVSASSTVVERVESEPVITLEELSGNHEMSEEEVIVTETKGVESIDTFPNSMMMASTTLDNPCSVCKRDIKSGDSFIYCLNCGKPGHYAHLGEMIKVTGKCPICKNRLTPTMYDI